MKITYVLLGAVIFSLLFVICLCMCISGDIEDEIREEMFKKWLQDKKDGKVVEEDWRIWVPAETTREPFWHYFDSVEK